MTKLFLFPHQDDEFGVFYLLKKSANEGEIFFCAFLTASPKDSKYTNLRNDESGRVLKRIGVPGSSILFLGDKLSVKDGSLVDSIENIANWLTQFLIAYPQIDDIYVPAWEGGHPDHDVLNFITGIVASSIGRRINLWQFPLYNSKLLGFGLFRVMSPLEKNGKVNSLIIPFKDRIRFLMLCFSYKSQWRSWVGLWPLMAYKYLTEGRQQIQEIDLNRHLESPHQGKLYYEYRGFASWETIKYKIDLFSERWSNKET